MTILRSLIRPILALVAILLAAAAQYLHIYRQADWTALALFGIAAAFGFIAFFSGAANLTTRLDDSTEIPKHARALSRPLAISAILLAALTFLFSGGNQFNTDNLMAWAASLAAFLYVFWEPEKSWQAWRMQFEQAVGSAQRAFAEGWRISPRALILAAILLVGAFFYFHNLDGVPAEMDSDHAEKLLDVNDVVNNGLAPIFFERNTGREPIQFYLTAALISLTQHPMDYLSLKLVTATLGWLVIPGVFLFARELFDDDVALLAAAFTAISKWPLALARMGLRFPLTPVFVAPLLFFLFRAFKYQRRNDFLMAGLFLGAGLYGYNAFRIAPVLVAVFMLLWLLIDRRMGWAQVRRFIVNGGLAFAVMFVVLMPLLRYSIERPDQIAYRMITRLTGEGLPIPGNPVEILATNLVKASAMFNWTGDMAWPNSVIGDPALDYILGSLFLLGVVFALGRLVRQREPAYAFLLIGLGITLLPSALSLAFPEENPSIVRAGGAIPFVFILAALPVAWLARAIQQGFGAANHSEQSEIESNELSLATTQRNPLGQLVAAAVIAGVLLVSARANYLRYFRDFDSSYRAHSWNSSEVAAAIRGFANSIGDLDHAWLIAYPHWIDTRNVAVNLGQIEWANSLPSAADARKQANDSANKLYVLNEGDVTNLETLQQIFPNGQQRLYHARTPGHDFLLFYVPGTIAPDAILGTQ